MIHHKKEDRIIALGEDNIHSELLIGLGWDKLKAQTTGFFRKKIIEFDCDAAAILVRKNRFITQEDVVYYNKLKHKSGCVELLEDNRTGDGEGDDEQIIVHLDKVPDDVEKIVIAVNIYDAIKRKQHFGIIENLFIRILDNNTKEEFCRFDITKKYTGMTTLVFGELKRNMKNWIFEFNGIATKNSDFLDVLKMYM